MNIRNRAKTSRPLAIDGRILQFGAGRTARKCAGTWTLMTAGGRRASFSSHSF